MATKELPYSLMTPSNNVGGVSSAYKSAVTTQAGDYDRIMKGYDDLFNSSRNSSANNINQTFTPLTPTYMQQAGTNRTYQQTPEFAQAMAGLRGFSQNGGFSANDISNMRSRATSPIRSAYATALKELNRRKSLQGGYSPNHGAVLAKFAREQSGMLSDKYTDIEGMLADKVAGNKLASLQALGPLALQEQQGRNAFEDKNVSDRNEVDRYNTNLINEFNKYNSEGAQRVSELNRDAVLNNNRDALSALSGQTQLYGTSPALVNTFGNQVLQDRNQSISNNANRANMGLSLISQLNNSRRYPVAG